jgi:hypothetical protein
LELRQAGREPARTNFEAGITRRNSVLAWNSRSLHSDGRLMERLYSCRENSESILRAHSDFRSILAEKPLTDFSGIEVRIDALLLSIAANRPGDFARDAPTSLLYSDRSIAGIY